MRTEFDKQLKKLHGDLLEMGTLCEDAITMTAQMLDGREGLTAKISAAEMEIDHKQREVESRCRQILLRQQPVACDLRVISTALKIVPDMERIGDQAVDISELMPSIAGFEFAGRVHIKEMAGATVKMVTESVQAFVDSNEMLAEKVIASDDLVDQLFDKVKEELVELICQKSIDVVIALDFLMTAKYFERIGDHAVNIVIKMCGILQRSRTFLKKQRSYHVNLRG